MAEYCEAAKSDCSSEEEWMDLSKSDYARVIFSKLNWNDASGEVSCEFTLTEDVNKDESDYIGLFKVGFDNISQCLAMKKLKDLNVEADSKTIYCCFKSEELPELSGFYQFLYITHDKEVCGASMPFEVNVVQSKDSPADLVVTERVENDFLMVRYGLEETNQKLETMMDFYRKENSVLIDNVRELENEKELFQEEITDRKSQYSKLSNDYQKQQDKLREKYRECEDLKDRYENDSKELLIMKAKEGIISADLASHVKENEDLRKRLENLEETNAQICKLTESAEIEFGNMERNLKEQLIRVGEQKDVVIDKLEKEVKDLKSLLEKKDADIRRLEKHIISYSQELICMRLQTNKFQNEYYCKGKNDESSEISDAYCKLKADFEKKEKAFSELEAKYEKFAEKEELLAQKSAELEKVGGEVFHKFEKDLLMQKERLTKESTLKEKMLKKQLLLKEQDLKLMSAKLETARAERNEFENKVMQFHRYLQNKDDFRKYCQWESNQENSLMASQVADANFMIKALEDSKQLAMKEMSELSAKLKKVKKDLSEARCENIVLKISLEGQSTPHEKSVQKKEQISDKRTQTQNNDLLQTVFQELQEIDPTVALHNLGEKILHLIRTSKEQDKETERILNSQASEILQVKEELSASKSKMETLLKEKEFYKQLSSTAQEDAADKTARIMQAAVIYKDIYKQKEKLAKKLKKVLDLKRQGKKSAVTKVQGASEAALLPFDIESSSINSEVASKDGESTSNNSDSDTGEHVRFQKILYPDMKKDENYTSEFPVLTIRGNATPVEAEEELADNDNTLLDLNEALENYAVSEALKDRSRAQEIKRSLEEEALIPCTFCGEEFLTTPYSNVPMMEHLEKVHNTNMCPLCGQLFDKCFPSKYLEFHINDHFRSE